MNDDRKYWKVPLPGKPVAFPKAHGLPQTHLESLMRQRCLQPSDINEHLPLLWDYAFSCAVICEFGVRAGNSTIAFLAGLEAGGSRKLPGVLHSWDIEPPQFERPALSPWVVWDFRIGDTAHLKDFPECDLLFIDTAHTHVHVTAELQYQDRVRRWIVFHDTVLYGDVGMDGKPGVRHAAQDFLAKNDRWQAIEDHHNCNGLLVLEKR